MQGVHLFEIFWDDLREEKRQEILNLTKSVPECFINKPVTVISLVENMDYKVPYKNVHE